MSGRAAELAATVQDALESFPGAPCSCPKHKFLLDAATALSELAALAESQGAAGWARAMARAAELERRAEAAEARNTQLADALREIRDEDLEWSKATDYLQGIARAALARHTEGQA